jgi:hypothetical protein
LRCRHYRRQRRLASSYGARGNDTYGFFLRCRKLALFFKLQQQRLKLGKRRRRLLLDLTTLPDSVTFAYVINANNGNLNNSTKTTSNFVRCVRQAN